MHCQFVIGCIDRNIESPLGYDKDTDFGDRLLISKCADEKDLTPNIDIAHILLSNFPDMKMTIRAHIDPKKHKKNPEYTINGMIADRKGVEKEKGIADGFKRAIEQTCNCVVIDLNTNFIRKKVNFRAVASRIDWRAEDFISGKIQECYVVYKDKAVVIHGLTSLDEIKAIIKRLES